MPLKIPPKRPPTATQNITTRNCNQNIGSIFVYPERLSFAPEGDEGGLGPQKSAEFKLTEILSIGLTVTNGYNTLLFLRKRKL